MASKYREQLLRAACAFRESGDEQAFLSEADRVIAAVSEEPMLPWEDHRLARGRKMSRARDKAHVWPTGCTCGADMVPGRADREAEAPPETGRLDPHTLRARLREQGHSLMSLGTRRATVVPQAEAKIHQLAALLFEAANALEAHAEGCPRRLAVAGGAGQV